MVSVSHYVTRTSVQSLVNNPFDERGAPDPTFGAAPMSQLKLLGKNEATKLEMDHQRTKWSHLRRRSSIPMSDFFGEQVVKYVS